MYKIIITFLLLGQAMWAYAKPPSYEKRKKVGIQRLNALIGQNYQNQLRGMVHKNWYIFSDKEPIEEVGMKFFFKDNQLIQKLNEQIRRHNQATGHRFYVKLNGFEMVHVVNILEKMGILKDSLQADSLDKVKRFKAASQEVYASVGKAYKDFYKKINQLTEEELAQYRAYESTLTGDIFNASKLGTYGALLSVTGLYYYWEAEKDAGLRVEYEKSIALGLGFLGKSTSELLTIQQDSTQTQHNNRHSKAVYALDAQVMLKSLKEPLKDKELVSFDKSKFFFSVNPDEALRNYVSISLAFLKANEVTHRAKDEVGYNVIYLINVWDKIARGKIATPELEQVALIANNYLDQLKVATRVVLYEGDPKKFDYASLSSHEGVAFIGAREEADTKDFINAIEQLGGDNATYANILRAKEDDGVSFEGSSSIKEKSPQYYLQNFNRIVLHYARLNDRGTQTILGAGHQPPRKPLHEALAFSLIHGAGHNAEKDPVKIFGKVKGEGEQKGDWNHYAGVGVMKAFGKRDNDAVSKLLRFDQDTTVAAYKDSTYERGKKIPWYYGGGGGKESKVAISQDLLPWAHCPLPPQRRKSIILKQPSSFPNEAYYYSMQDHFGAYRPYSKRANIRFINKQ